jgi:PST family polysaccharide transporter
MSESTPGSTAAAVVAGTSWTALSRIGLQIFSIVSATVMARFVPPRAYGLVGMAQVVIGFASLFRDIGTPAAIIRQKQIDDELLTSVFWLNLAMGLFATSACCLAAPFVARFYSEPALLTVFQALSLYFLIASVSNVHSALMNRGFQFARIAAVELLAGAAGLIVGVVSAMLGAGVWSLIAGGLTTAIISSILFVALSPWRPTLSFSSRRLRSLMGFGLNLSGFNVVNYFGRNADNLLIGKYLGASPLAYYGFAYNLMLFPVQGISWTVGRVLLPALAQMQDDCDRFGRAYLRACAAIAFVAFPLMAGVTLLTPEFIAVLLGPKWKPVVPVLRILAPVGMVQSVITTTGQIYTAMGKTDTLFKWGLASTAITVAGFVVGLRWGIIGVASAYAVVMFLLLVPTFWIPFHIIHLPMRNLWIALWPVVQATVVMSATVGGLRWLVLGSTRLPAFFVLLVCAGFGAAIYFAMMYWRSRQLLADFVMLARAGLGVFGRVRLRPANALGWTAGP